MENREIANEGAENGVLNEKKRKKFNILALIICMMVAVLIWCYAKGTAIRDGRENVNDPTATEIGAEQND